VSVTISRAGPGDTYALTALRIAVARDMTDRHGDGPWSALPSKAVVVRQIRASHALIARCDDEAVGTVRLAWANPAIFDSASFFTPASAALYVLGLAVAPAHRHEGIGRELIEASKQVARDWPAQALWLDTYDHAAGAGGFYERCGFREVGASALNHLPLLYYEWSGT
jgi:GNAT superfamily N-acetyltransferase